MADHSEKCIIHTVHNIILRLLNKKGRDFGTHSTYGIKEISINFSSKFNEKTVW
jgi:hypothetical protein